VIGNVFVDESPTLCISPKERLAGAANYLFLSYMLAIPVVLFFLKGERIWRLVAVILWLLQIALLGYTMMTTD